MFTLEKQNPTLKSPIEEHACLDSSDFHSTLLVIFYTHYVLRATIFTISQIFEKIKQQD